MRHFVFHGSWGSSASTETLKKRASYGGRKGRRAQKRLDEHLTWSEVSERIAQSHGVSTVYVDDRRDINIPHAAVLPSDATINFVIPTTAEIRIGEQ